MEKLKPEDIKTLKRLARAVQHAYDSPWRLFARGILWGLATGLGATIVLAVVLWVLSLIFGQVLNSAGIAETLNNIQSQIQNQGQQ